MKKNLFLSLLLVAPGGQWSNACSTLMVGRLGTADGSVLMSHSCDGDVMGLAYVMPAQSYPPGTRLPMYWNIPRPKTYADYQANLRKGFDQVGTLEVSETYRSLILAGNLESMTTGGLNEHGNFELVSIQLIAQEMQGIISIEQGSKSEGCERNMGNGQDGQPAACLADMGKPHPQPVHGQDVQVPRCQPLDYYHRVGV
jgi:hypothetical protein